MLVLLPGNLSPYFFSLSRSGTSHLLSVVGMLDYVRCHLILPTIL